MEFDMTLRANRDNLELFAEELLKIQDKVDFKISSRGWCYQLESERVINKDQFGKIESWINRCRKEGILPVDFVAEEAARQFSGIEEKERESPLEWLKNYIQAPLNCHEWYTPDWWDGEDYYIQMLVEKIDLKTLFAPVCEKYHIAVATSKGWSSIIQRAEYTRRFKEAEDRGLKCVLLYCGDHDPDGLRISDFIKNNLHDLRNVVWGDGTEGYNPNDLIIERFGLNADFIEQHSLTWIDNLVTGKKTGINDLSDPRHRNHNMPYVQEYLQEFGARKCEANAIVPIPDIARDMVRETIESYLNEGALDRFDQKKQTVKDEMDEIREKTGLSEVIQKTIKLIEEE